MKNKTIIVALACIVAIILTGYLVPAIAISDGTGEYTGEEKEYAEKAIWELEALHLSSPSLYKLYTTKHKVIKLENTNKSRCKYKVIIAGHTYFGREYIKHEVMPGCYIRSGY